MRVDPTSLQMVTVAALAGELLLSAPSAKIL